MRSQRMLLGYIKWLLALSFLFPFTAYAHLISITALTPFPTQINLGISASASYQVTNISPQTTVTVVDQSKFPNGSGLTITSSTCGSPIKPGMSCTINVSLAAHTTAQTISAELQEWAKPTADGVKYPITITVINNTVTPSAGANGAISPSTPQSVGYNDSVIFTALPNTGYNVNQWKVDGVVDPSATGNTTYTLNGVTTNHTVSVSFAIKGITVTASAGSGGSVSPNGASTVNYGGNLTFTATPGAGFAVNQWSVDGVVDPSATGNTTYTLSNVTTTHTVSVSFTQAFTVTSSVSGSGGTVNQSIPSPVAIGSNVTFTATPNTNYNVNTWIDNGVTVQTGGGSYTITNVLQPHVLTVSFNAALAVTSSVTGSGGTVSQNIPSPVPFGSNVSFTATPNTNYNVNSWIDNGVTVQTGGTSYSISNVTAAHTVTVSFNAPLAVTASVTGSGGTVGQSIPSPVPSGSNVTFTATPDTNYIVNTWIDNGVTVQTGGGNYSISNVTADHTVTVSFIESFLVTPSVSGAGGTISPSTPQPVNSGGNITFTATSNPGFSISGWTDNGSPVCGTSTTCLIGSISANHAIVVSFVQQTFTVTSSAGSDGLVSPLGANTVNSGGSITFTATPAAGFGVFQWLLDGSVAQTGGTTFTLNSVTATHIVAVTFGTAILVAAGGNYTTFASPTPFLATSNDAGTTWTIPTIASIPASGYYSASSCAGSGGSASCIATGYNQTATNPFVVASTDGGVSWNVQPGAIPGSGNGTYNAATCSAGTTPVCVVAGQAGVAPFPNSSAPLFAVSLDGPASSWTFPTVISAPSAGTLLAASCTGNSTANIVCIAGGQDLTGVSAAPLLYISIDGAGATWAKATFTGGTLPVNGTINAVSCTGDTIGTDVCIAAGQDTNNNYPLLAVSTNGASNFSVISIPGAPASGIFSGASCSGTDGSAVCVAAGQNTTVSPAQPLLAVSTNGGVTWNANITIAGTAPASGYFTSASCTQNGPSGICVAVGQANVAPNNPIMASSIDGGNTWQWISPALGSGILEQVSCTGNMTTSAVCLAAGQTGVTLYPNPVMTGSPLLLTTKNGGSTAWTQPATANPLFKGIYFGTGASGGTLAKILGIDGIFN